MPNEDLTPAIAALIVELQAQGDPNRALHEKAYMKSQRDFYGVTKPAIDRLARAFYRAHKPLSADALIPHIDRLFRADNFDETSLGVSLAACYADAFNVQHLEHPLSDWFDLCEGWAHCDELAAHVSGAVILADPSGIPTVYAWRTRPVLWTRRASILSHLLAIRAKRVPLNLFLDT